MSDKSQAQDILDTYLGKGGDHSVKIELFIKGEGGVIFQPAVTDEIVWETELRGSPSKLTFTVIKEDGVAAEAEELIASASEALGISEKKEATPKLSFPEGAPVILRVNDTNVFQGFVFEKSRNKKQQIQCICYDQMRYLKNKHYMEYKEKTATEVIRDLANDYQLQVGDLVDTEYKIPPRIEKDKSAFDIILKALDITTGQLPDEKKANFVLYDDFGKLMLKNQKDWYVPVVINEYTAQDFDYTSSIDKDTYNVVRIYPEKGETSKTLQEPASATNDVYMKAWGILRYNETVPNELNLQKRANARLKQKCRPTRDLTIKNAFGDLRVRAGCHVPVMLGLGDRVTNYCLRCDKVTHRITSNYHVMDLTLSGHKGEFGED